MGLLEWINKKMDLEFNEEQIRKATNLSILTYYRVFTKWSSVFDSPEKRTYATAYSLFFKLLQEGRIDHKDLMIFCPCLRMRLPMTSINEMSLIVNLPMVFFSMQLALIQNKVSMSEAAGNEYMFSRCLDRVEQCANVSVDEMNSITFPIIKDLQKSNNCKMFDTMSQNVDERVANIEQDWFNLPDARKIHEMFKNVTPYSGSFDTFINKRK